MRMKFVFDLDGTVTKQETLPLIAKHFGVEEEIETLTRETVKGNVPFIESFIKRVFILGKLPVSEIDSLLSNVELYERVFDFIKQNNDKCIIATGNLKCWTASLSSRLGCDYYGSDCVVENDRVAKLTKIFRKEDIVKKYQEDGYRVVFIGDGNNDLEGMRMSDVSIAVGLTHEPASSVLSVADYLVYTEEALCRLLSQLC